MAKQHRKNNNSHGCLIAVIAAAAAVALMLILANLTGFSTRILDRIQGLFYKQDYVSEVKAASEEFGVDRNLIYAVIKTESGFREDVVSSAGAIGLMQLMPDTFTWLQEKLDGEVKYTAEDLKDPAVNIRYGAYYLSYLTELYGSERTALAAYNAGTSNVDRWLADPDCSPDGWYLESIPYPETERYVEKVLSAREKYEKLYGIGVPDSR